MRLFWFFSLSKRTVFLWEERQNFILIFIFVKCLNVLHRIGYRVLQFLMYSWSLSYFVLMLVDPGIQKCLVRLGGKLVEDLLKAGFTGHTESGDARGFPSISYLHGWGEQWRQNCGKYCIYLTQSNRVSYMQENSWIVDYIFNLKNKWFSSCSVCLSFLIVYELLAVLQWFPIETSLMVQFK